MITHCYPQTDDREIEQLKAAYGDLAQTTFEQGQQLVLNLAAPEGISFHSSILANIETRSIIATPLKSKESNHGVLVAARHKADFAASDGDFLAVLSGQASIALENARLFTQIQEAYDQLQMLDHMKSEFINIAAHELRTPLSILMGYAAVLEDELEGVQQDYLSKITRNALRLRALVDDMLNLKHLESGKISLNQDEVDLPEVFTDIIQDMSLMIEEKELSLETIIPPDFPPMTVDRQKLDLIIMNLMHNAIKFTPVGGQITFRAESDDNKAIMAIRDTGIGIPPKEVNRIFDRFYQVSQSLTREHGGIGLGLAITKGMVEVCGGTIRVDSEETRGTTFTVTLPLDNSLVEARSLKLD
jgi:signal transduction histidine kinase